MEDLTCCPECEWSGESVDAHYDAEDNPICPDCNTRLD
jgi:hypothetical protein